MGTKNNLKTQGDKMVKPKPEYPKRHRRIIGRFIRRRDLASLKKWPRRIQFYYATQSALTSINSKLFNSITRKAYHYTSVLPVRNSQPASHP